MTNRASIHLTFNRTIVELKLGKYFYMIRRVFIAFNRTIVELKRSKLRGLACSVVF